MENNRQLDRFDQLRERAESFVQFTPDEFAGPTGILELIHELKVHQAELEIQNEELQRAQQEIAALHEEYADLYEFAPCTYIVLSPKKMISRINLTGVKLLGAERVLLKGMPLASFFVSASQAVYYEALQLAAKTGDHQSVEIKLKTEDDSPTWVRADVQPDLADTGELTQWRLTLVDITETKGLEQKALDYQNKLKSMAYKMALIEERVKHDLCLKIHDQISQTLAMSRVKLGMLGDSLGDPKSKAILAEVYNDLGDILGETRSIMTELTSPVLEMLGLKKAVAEWATQNIQKKYHVDTVVTGNDGGKPLAEDTQNILFRSICELLCNVVKHAHATCAQVNLQCTHNLVEIRVTDNGRGFPADFESDPRMKTCFGLMSIRESMEKLGGQLTIDSASGHGTTAILNMPVCQAEVPDERDIQA